ncbi:hypothetical protein CCH79_00013292, partial [Gambusia affinis]
MSPLPLPLESHREEEEFAGFVQQHVRKTERHAAFHLQLVAHVPPIILQRINRFSLTERQSQGVPQQVMMYNSISDPAFVNYQNSCESFHSSSDVQIVPFATVVREEAERSITLGGGGLCPCDKNWNKRNLLDQTNHPSGGCLISPNTFPTLDHVEARSLPFYIIRSLSGGTSSDSERPPKMKARKIESDGSCLLGAAGSEEDGADGLISCSDYLLITIRLKPLAEEENFSETTTSYQPLQTDDRKAADMRVDRADRNGCIKGSGRKHHSHRRARIGKDLFINIKASKRLQQRGRGNIGIFRSAESRPVMKDFNQISTVVDVSLPDRGKSRSFDGVLSPRAKGKKKKKRKSERKRKRRRSPSHSLSPVRKKKKKKKKSSKKSKRHSSSSLKRKRKDERKHKKSSRTHSSRRRRHYRRSESYASSSRSFTGDSQLTKAFPHRHLQKSVVHQAFRAMGGTGEETRAALIPTEAKWRHASKSVCKTAPKYRSILSAGTILSLKPGSELVNGKGAQDFSSHAEGTRDYDSGNDTSSPPSSKTGVSRASVAENQRNCCQRLTSPPEKQRFADRDNGSDSGNSVTSYASSCKPCREHGFSATIFSGNSKSGQITLGCEEEVVRCPKAARCAQRRSRSSRKRRKAQSSSSSRSRSSGTSRYSGRYSRSPSMSSCSSYSRSLSNSSDVRRRGSLVSLSSRGSYSKYSADRLRDRKRQSSSRETNLKHMHKVSGKRRRRKSYSPMRKRRRDSPSHLEARRITSARKRPIPYFRPSPSASSRSTSVSSWSSLFTRSRSRSPIHSVSRSHSRSCSRSYSSYRSYSRSSSWNSIFGSHSRSRSRGSLKKRRKAR